MTYPNYFVELDLSQAENRIVGMLTGDAELMELANTPPWEFDVHTHNATVIFNKPASEITKMQRYLGKRFVHATNYGMAGDTASDALLKEGYVIPPAECQRYIDAYLNRYPAIAAWQGKTRAQILQHRKLVNSWGRIYDVTYERLCDEIYRSAYSFIPQSEVVDWLNQYGLKPMWKWLRKYHLRSRINAHVHDALLISCTHEEGFAVMGKGFKLLERTREIGAGTLQMFTEAKIGRTWKGDVEFKRMPSEGEFNLAVDRMFAEAA